MAYNILLVDDDVNHAQIAQKIIERDGQYKTKLASNGRDAIDYLTSGNSEVDLVLLDLAMPGIDGINVLNAVKPVKPDLPIIISSGFDDVELVAKAMKAGATDFIRKLDNPEKLKTSIDDAIRNHVLKDEIDALKKAMGGHTSFNDILGSSKAIEEVKILGRKVAASSIPVLIEGENGCGKELLARSIHYSSERASKPFIAVNCGAIPDNLVESILFGHEKGAFTGAIYKTYGKFREADGGTIFLDEVGELAPEIQVKLLRVLQDGEIDPVGSVKPVKVNVRVISATNRNLALEVKKGSFREDLYYRLNVFPIRVPALRERDGDLPLMIDHFTKLFVKSEHKDIKGITPLAQDMLCKYKWPGNIRQLKNTIFRAIVLCDRDMLDIGDFPSFKDDPNIDEGNASFILGEPGASAVYLQSADGHFKKLSEIEKHVIESALRHYNGRMSEVARRLGIGRSTLYRKLEAYGVAFVEDNQ